MRSTKLRRTLRAAITQVQAAFQDASGARSRATDALPAGQLLHWGWPARACSSACGKPGHLNGAARAAICSRYLSTHAAPARARGSRTFSAHAAPATDGEQQENLGFVRGGFSVEDFPPAKA